MAIVQISRITHRKGLQENLPQLAGAELGWAVDSRRLFIGNGTLAEGAPVIGNTEILTQFSDILSLANQYTYRGEATGYIAQTGPFGGDVTRTLQEKFDDIVSIKDFGAIGDGATNDTAAIEQAIYEVFGRSTEIRARKALFFPAGSYIVTRTILIPPNATLVGEGMASSVLILETDSGSSHASTDFVIRTADSQFQTGASIGTNGATPPRNIRMMDIGVRSLVDSSGILIEKATNVHLVGVDIRGIETLSTLVPAGLSTGIEVYTEGVIESKNISIERCAVQGLSHGVVCNSLASSIKISGSVFNMLYYGIRTGVGGLGVVSGISVSQNTFDLIAAEGIFCGPMTESCSSISNSFFNVGTNFDDTNPTPGHSVIKFESPMCVSYGDMFARSVDFTKFRPIVDVGTDGAIALEGASRLRFGTYSRIPGVSVQVPLGAGPHELARVPVPNPSIGSFEVDYVVRRQDGTATRRGKLTVSNSTTSPIFQDDYLENTDVGVELFLDKDVDVIAPFVDQDVVVVKCNVVSSPAATRHFSFSVTQLD